LIAICLSEKTDSLINRYNAYLAVGADFFTTCAVRDDHQNNGWFCERNGFFVFIEQF
jgi:2-methylisocitrate lyase-like PEP mutase family enzyme